ncbi:hypothetical protein [Phytoactinopolyspora mesophila]|uniref:Uncharacterized protein n=1 Tax=Phytoactinopolyspora mesophila TaxID=2650750 RepID=A0A7K3M638_9ACTN|nr:hypothetical protein [Phytoactinopolyspora mesophila]NDL58715.1 hypothetical protein [Phytoactinopolyspora mesophila]
MSRLLIAEEANSAASVSSRFAGTATAGPVPSSNAVMAPIAIHFHHLGQPGSEELARATCADDLGGSDGEAEGRMVP